MMYLIFKLGRFQAYVCFGKVYDPSWDRFHDQGVRLAWLGKKFWVWNVGKGLRDARLDPAN